jgi:aminoglycoside phosphotransferase (APT) family kinase protein/GNAT superfamily N-acetyltransferase
VSTPRDRTPPADGPAVDRSAAGGPPLDRTPPADVDTSPEVVAALLRAQHPDLAHRPLAPAEEGWDNVTHRLGDDLAVRLPRRASAAGLLANEQRWLPEIAPRLPLPVPAPVRTGAPGAGYPYPWSVVPWFAGDPADRAPLATMEGATLGRFLAALHHRAPDDAPRNPVRGGPFAERAELARDRLRALADAGALRSDGGALQDGGGALQDGGGALQDGGGVLCADGVALRDDGGGLRDDGGEALDLDVLLGVLDAAAEAPPAETAVWCHGDLHPRNLVVHDAKLVAVVDWGDLTAGDRAVDLAVAWLLLDAHGRAGVRAAAGSVDDATWTRARGWAVHLGAVLLRAGLADDPRHAAVGRRALAAVAHEVATTPRPRRAASSPDAPRPSVRRVDERLGLAVDRVSRSGRTLVTYARDHVTVRTPSRADFRDGNTLDLEAVPDPADLDGWIDRFAATIGTMGVGHVQLRWESPLPPDAPAEAPAPPPAALNDALTARGFTLEPVTVLLLDELRDVAPVDAQLTPVEAPSLAPGAAVDRRWHAATVLYRYESGDTVEDWRRVDDGFVTWAVDVQRELVRDGRAEVWLAVRHAAPVGRATIVHDRQGLAAVEDVIVHPVHRRRGIAAALTHAAIAAHLGVHPGSRVGLGAEPGSSADRLYRRLGFAPHATVWTALRLPR